jgi:pSer/pThr/pTyr-binding forkhead associated (FHA) protein
MLIATAATQPPPAEHPRLTVASSGMYFDISGRIEVLIGRVDPFSQIFPEIDLTAYGGDEGGVSRKHCRITLAGNQFFVEDLNSSNGTWIGTCRLSPGVRTALNNGDQLRLGKLLLNFFGGGG